MPNCAFCNGSIKHTGKMYVQKSGKVMYFCSMKCEKNYLKLKRKPLETKWVTKKKKTKEEKKK